MIARDRTRLQAACGDAHERVITRELGGVGAAAQRDSGPSLLEESESVARCRGETRGPSPTLTVPEPTLPYPTVPESTLPYPTVPGTTLPSPTVPEPTLPYPHGTRTRGRRESRACARLRVETVSPPSLLQGAVAVEPASPRSLSPLSARGACELPQCADLAVAHLPHARYVIDKHAESEGALGDKGKVQPIVRQRSAERGTSAAQATALQTAKAPN